MSMIREKSTSRRLFVVLLLITAAAAAQGPPSSAPDLAAEWSGPTLTVAGVTAGGEVILFLVERLPANYRVTNAEYRRVATDEDGDGVVSFTIDGEPFRSLAVAFDVESGSYGLAFRGLGLPPREVPFDSRGHFAQVLGATGLEYAVQRANVFVGRPHEGAWTVFVGDRGPLDEDGEVNGQFLIPPQALERIGTAGSGPNVFLPHDLLVVVEPRRMEFSVSRLVDPPKPHDR